VVVREVAQARRAHEGRGATTLDYQLRNLIPSFNVATHPISSGTNGRPRAEHAVGRRRACPIGTGKPRAFRGLPCLSIVQRAFDGRYEPQPKPMRV